MTKALVALHDTTYGGVYYSANVDFVAKTDPVWAKYASTGLANNLIACMQTDYADPYGTVYVQLDNGDVYKWNGASWTKIMDLATARTATGLAGGVLGLICANKTIAGRIYLPISQTTVSQYVLVSTDYGANWTARLVINYVALTDPSYVQATGDHVWLCYGHLYRSMQYSDDNGATWKGDYGIWGTTGGGDAFNIDPLDGTGSYFRASATDPDLTRYYYSGGYGFTALQVGKGLGEIFLSAGVQIPAGAYWASWITSGKQRVIKEATGGIRMYSTTNAWTGLVEASPTDWDATIAAGVQAIHAAREDEANVLIGCGQDAAGVPRVFAWTGEATSTLPWNCGGANYNSAPYTDSLPSPNNSYVPAYGVFCGNAPATSGIYIYSVETDAYDYAHKPMLGDRASHRDLDANTNENGDPDSYTHAEDIQKATPQRHNPWPASSGQAPVSDGSKWVATDIATQNEIEAISDVLHNHEINEDHTPECDGLTTLFTTDTYFLSETVAVYLNGVRQRIYIDYTLASSLDSVTFTTAPESGDMLIFDYLCKQEDAVARRILISEQTPTGTGTVTFSSIPATYKELCLCGVARGTTVANNVGGAFRLNNDLTDANYRTYTDQQYTTAHNTLGTDNSVIFQVSAASAPAGSCGQFEFKILNYASTTFNKYVMGMISYRYDNTSLHVVQNVSTMEWESTAAVNRIDIILSAGNFDTGSTFRLYGVY